MQRALCRALSTELRNVYGKYPRFYWPDSIPNNYCNFNYKFIGPNVILILFKRLQNNYVEKRIAETYHMTQMRMKMKSSINNVRQIVIPRLMFFQFYGSNPSEIYLLGSINPKYKMEVIQD